MDREEYIEQAYFFRTFGERLDENLPAQEILESLREEILATTKLPMAIDVMRGELMHQGRLSDGLVHLKNYFAPWHLEREWDLDVAFVGVLHSLPQR